MLGVVRPKTANVIGLLSEAEGKNLVFGKQAFYYAKNEILRLHYVPAQNDNTSIELTEY